MDRNELLQHKKLLRCLSCLPKQILSLHSWDNVPEFVLHGLCSKDCFNLYKAAYFIDNPDFDFVKGVAGYSKEEGDLDWNNIWEDPESFSLFTNSLPFNKRVRSFNSNSVKRKDSNYDGLLKKIACDVGFDNPSICTWDMKHYNNGILVYEKVNDENADLFNEYFSDSVHLLSFCPIVL